MLSRTHTFLRKTSEVKNILWCSHLVKKKYLTIHKMFIKINAECEFHQLLQSKLPYSREGWGQTGWVHVKEMKLEHFLAPYTK